MAPKLLQFFRNLFPTRKTYVVYQPEGAAKETTPVERYVQKEVEPEPVEPEVSTKEPENPSNTESDVPESVATFMSFDARKMAEQMTVMDGETFKTITPEESKSALEHNLTGAPHVVHMMQRSEHLKIWVRDLLLSTGCPKLRCQVLARIILLAHCLVKLNNLHSANAIVEGLYSGPIIRLTNTWRKLGWKSRQWFRKLSKKVHDPLEIALKHWEAWESYGPRCVPHIRYLYDLSDPDDGLEHNVAVVEYLQTGKFHLIAPKDPVLQDYLFSIQFSYEQQRELAVKAKQISLDLEPKERKPLSKNQLPWRPNTCCLLCY